MSSLQWSARLARIAAPALAIAGAAAWSQPAVGGADLWIHLASGREIWAQHGPFTADPFSFTFAGRPWINPAWLWGAIFWRLREIHPELVAWFQLVLVLALFAAIYVTARRLSGSALAAGAATWICGWCSHWFFDVRPHLVTLLFTAVILATRERAWAPWLWPPLIALWANLHAGFLFGIAAIGILVAARAVQASLERKRVSIAWSESVGLALAMVAWLANPWGRHIADFSWSVADSSSPFRALAEWRPPGFSMDPARFEGRLFWTACAAAAGVVCGWRKAPGAALVAALALAMACTSRRFIPLFAVCAAPMAAAAFAAALRPVRERVALLRSSRAAWTALAVVFAAVCGMWRGVRVYPHLLKRWTQGDLLPVGAVRYLNALGPPTRLLNFYSWAGFLMLEAPDARVFTDGRAGTLYDHALLADYQAMLRADPRLPELVAKYELDAAILAPGPLAQALQELPEPWTLVYADSLAWILLPPTSPLLAAQRSAMADVLEDDGELGLAHARLAQNAGDLDAAVREVEAVLARDPLLVHAYAELAFLYASRGDDNAVAATIERGIRADPRRRQDLRSIEGQVWEARGELAKAIAAFREAVPTDPFSPREPMLAHLRDLEARAGASP